MKTGGRKRPPRVFNLSINQRFVLLAILGIINDPTTAGLDDSAQAMEYRVPKADPEF